MDTRQKIIIVLTSGTIPDEVLADPTVLRASTAVRSRYRHERHR